MRIVTHPTDRSPSETTSTSALKATDDVVHFVRFSWITIVMPALTLENKSAVVTLSSQTDATASLASLRLNSACALP